MQNEIVGKSLEVLEKAAGALGWWCSSFTGNVLACFSISETIGESLTRNGSHSRENAVDTHDQA